MVDSELGLGDKPIELGSAMVVVVLLSERNDGTSV